MHRSRWELIENPVLITSCDGSDSAFGNLVYVRWEAGHYVVAGLVEVKGKRPPLNLKGDTGKLDMCGAVFTDRLSKFVKENYTYQFTVVYHFIASMTVLKAINKESYEFSTFYASEVGEIQSTTNCDNWF